MCLTTKEDKTTSMVTNTTKTRRRKRDKDASSSPSLQKKPVRKSKSLQKHGNDAPSGGIEALLPSFIGLAILVCGVMAKMGFRGRATVAGIDLGTTNSVICVQAPSKTGMCESYLHMVMCDCLDAISLTIHVGSLLSSHS